MIELSERFVSLPVPSCDPLSDLLRHGAQRLLATAIQVVADEWHVARAHVKDPDHRQPVVRNGKFPDRLAARFACSWS
jgi:hypothetical protein